MTQLNTIQANSLKAGSYNPALNVDLIITEEQKRLNILGMENAATNKELNQDTNDSSVMRQLEQEIRERVREFQEAEAQGLSKTKAKNKLIKEMHKLLEEVTNQELPKSTKNHMKQQVRDIVSSNSGGGLGQIGNVYGSYMIEALLELLKNGVKQANDYTTASFNDMNQSLTYGQAAGEALANSDLANQSEALAEKTAQLGSAITCGVVLAGEVGGEFYNSSKESALETKAKNINAIQDRLDKPGVVADEAIQEINQADPVRNQQKALLANKNLADVKLSEEDEGALDALRYDAERAGGVSERKAMANGAKRQLKEVESELSKVGQRRQQFTSFGNTITTGVQAGSQSYSSMVRAQEEGEKADFDRRRAVSQAEADALGRKEGSDQTQAQQGYSTIGTAHQGLVKIGDINASFRA